MKKIAAAFVLLAAGFTLMRGELSNAVVVHDVPSYHTAVGVPARSFPTLTRKEREADLETSDAAI